MSKLIQRIERLGKAGPAPMGFGASARQPAPPAMVLVGTVTDPAKVISFSDAELDAVLYSHGPADADAAAQAGEASSETPWGVARQGSTAEDLQALATQGCDFVVLGTTALPLEALHHEDMGRLLVVSMDMQKEQARALEPLPLDAVVLSEPLDLPLTLEHLHRLATLRGEIGLPFLVHITATPTAWEVECLREVGVEGLMPDLDSASPEDVKAVAKAVRSIPRRKPRGDRPMASLPRMRADEGAHRHEPDEVDDEEEEEYGFGE